MKCRSLSLALPLAALATKAVAQDVAAGEKAFQKCRACHQVGEAAKNAVGPSLCGDVISFVAVMNLTMRTYLASKGHPADVVEKMHQAWCKSIQMQMSLWIGPYALDGKAPEDW